MRCAETFQSLRRSPPKARISLARLPHRRDRWKLDSSLRISRRLAGGIGRGNRSELRSDAQGGALCHWAWTGQEACPTGVITAPNFPALTYNGGWCSLVIRVFTVSEE